jgi:hypothetical protein
VHFRVLKLERQMSDLRGDFGKLLRPLSKLPTGDNELNDTISQIELNQQQAAAEHIAMYDHAAAPMPGNPGPEDAKASFGLKTDDEVKPMLVAPPPSSQPEYHPSAKPLDRADVPAPPRVETVQPPVKAADGPVLAKEEKAAVEQKTDAGVSGSSVTGIRVGEHPGKVRIVLDLSGASNFSAEIDNNEKVLLVDLPNTAWTTDMEKVFKNPLVKAYIAQKNENGVTLAVKLAAPAKLVMSTKLPPNQTYGHRIALDVGAL